MPGKMIVFETLLAAIPEIVPFPAKGNLTLDLDPPDGAQYPVLIRTVKTSNEPTATAGSKQLTAAPQPECLMAV